MRRVLNRKLSADAPQGQDGHLEESEASKGEEEEISEQSQDISRRNNVDVDPAEANHPPQEKSKMYQRQFTRTFPRRET